MKKSFKFAALLLSAVALLATSCDEPTPPEPPTPDKLEFEATISATTGYSVTYSVTPNMDDAEYLAVAAAESVLDQVGVGQELINLIMDSYKQAATQSGKSLSEYMATVVNKGAISDVVVSGLDPETDYSLIVYGVDSANNYAATSELAFFPFSTSALVMSNATFTVTAEPGQEYSKIIVTPSDENTEYFCAPFTRSDYEAYMNPEGNYRFANDAALVNALFNSYIANFLAQGATMEEALSQLVFKGTKTLELTTQPDKEYVVLVSAVLFDAGEPYTATETPAKVEFATEPPVASGLTFDISVSNIEANRADILITPSNLEEKFCWMVGAYNGSSTPEEVMNEIVAANKTWLDFGMMTYSGVQDFTEGGPMYKFKLDSPDTDYFVIAFGYNGGITSEPAMVTFRTLEAPSPADVEVNFSYTEVNAYYFKYKVDMSDDTSYYLVNETEEFNEAEVRELYANVMQEYLNMSQMFDPSVTMATVMSSYCFCGDSNQKSALQVEVGKSYTPYAVVFNMDGSIAKIVTASEPVTIPELGTVTPSVELYGFYSGDDENGEIFGQPEATAGKAIAVIKYGNLDNATALYWARADYDTTEDADSYIFGNAYWQPYDYAAQGEYMFTVLNWGSDYSFLAYTTDSNNQPGGIARAIFNTDPEYKGDYADLKALVDMLNSKSEVCSPLKSNIAEPRRRSGEIANRLNTEFTASTPSASVVATAPAAMEMPKAMPTFEQNEGVLRIGAVKPLLIRF